MLYYFKYIKPRREHMIKYEGYLTKKEAAKVLGVCINTLISWDKKGILKAYRHPISKYRLYKVEDLEAFKEKIAKAILKT